MPDAIRISDPFERASMDKTVTGIQWRSNAMQVMLPGLGNGFSVKPLNEGNTFSRPKFPGIIFKYSRALTY
jgi:hypothetical protein